MKLVGKDMDVNEHQRLTNGTIYITMTENVNPTVELSHLTLFCKLFHIHVFTKF